MNGTGKIIIFIVFPPIPLCIFMKTIKVKCAECGNEFNRSLSEYNRNKKIGREIFCNNSCQTINKNKKLTPEFRKKHCYDISKHAGNRQCEFSPFKPYLSKWRSSMVKHKNEIDIDQVYLKQLWESQDGICPYTGIKMILPKNTKEHQSIRSLKKASLDRIDSSKGYLKGNVEFVCYAINMAKNSFTRKDMKEFLLEMVEPKGVEPLSLNR